jgi:hypothetical protein
MLIHDAAIRELLYDALRLHIRISKAAGGAATDIIAANAIPDAVQILGFDDPENNNSEGLRD